MPCAATIVFWNIYTRCFAEDPSLYGMKYVYFISRSMTIHIESYSISVIGFLDSSSLTIKSNAIPCHGLLNSLISCIFPYGICRLYFVLLHLSHSLTIFFAI